MPRIMVLPPELASQIAAGEVAERPSSVVKELVENALDAEATRCDIEIEGGGITRLCVTDDGFGMVEEDARLCVERHATSKLRRVSDLNSVRSFGFRGEALPSIASVSRFSLCSRARESDSGVELYIEGGSVPRVRELGSAVGTRIEVKDLFFNVPARRKFLRSSATESGLVTEVIENAALARPDVTFSLERDGRRVREFLRAHSRAERVQQVLGDLQLFPCDGERGPLVVEAFLSRPEAARSGAAGLRLFANGRPIRDRAIAATVAHAYGSVLERGRYPRGVVYLDLPVELLDVNVHPQKAEVRFADPRAVTEALHGLLSRVLAKAFSLPERDAPGARVDPGRSEQPFSLPLGAQAPLSESSQRGPRDPVEFAPFAPELTPVARDLPSPSAPPPVLSVRDTASPAPLSNPSVTWSSLGFVAQLRQTYLLCEGSDGMYVLDQHAAAERVTFTRLCRAYRSRSVATQSLLFPVLVEVSTEEAELVDRRGRELAEVGLDARLRSPGTISIHAIPKLLVRADPERLLRDLLTEVMRTGERAFSNAVDLALATMACHGSIRAGDAVSASEAAALLKSLDEADFAGHCPHGRPVVSFISWGELERKVGRR